MRLLSQDQQRSFIHINNCFIVMCCQLLSEELPFHLIPLEVAVGLFFRVNPIFFSAREIVRSLISPCHSCAISTWVLSPWVKAFARNCSQSVILWLFPLGRLGNAWTSPVSALRFNHRLIVLRLILNSSLASCFLSPSNSMAWITLVAEVVTIGFRHSRADDSTSQ